MVTKGEYCVQRMQTPTVHSPNGRMQRALAWLRAALARRRTRARLRADLEHLDTRLLRDIGVRREDIVREAYRPFWRE